MFSLPIDPELTVWLLVVGYSFGIRDYLFLDFLQAPGSLSQGAGAPMMT